LFYLIPFFISTGISLAVGAYCWHRRAETGARMYALVAFSQALWTLGYIFELASPTLQGKIFWDNFQFIGGTGWFLGFLAFTLEYTGRRPARPALTYGLLAIPNVAMALLAFTDPLHGLVRPEAWLVPGEPFSALLYDFTLPMWLWGIYSYGAFLVCVTLFAIRYVRSHPLYQAQVGFILAGNVMPLIGTTLTLAGIIRGPYRDTTPFTFAIGNLIVAWGLFRYRLFDIVPLAWDKVIESMTDAVIVLDAQRRVVNLNPAARRMAGLGDAAVIGQPTSQLFAGWPQINEQHQEVQEARAEMEVDSPIGPRTVELRNQSLYDQHNRFKGCVIIVRDITDQKRVEDELRKHRDRLEDLVGERTAELVTTNEQLQQQMLERERLEEQLRQSQKLEAIGRLAGGIAHDFNNLLVPIIGYAQLSQVNLSPESKLYDNLMQIREAAERAAGLIRQLLAFSRQQVLETRALDLNQVIVGFQTMLQRVIGENIELQVFLDPSLDQVQADKGQIEQVLMNLVINARDAMPQGGKLSIETANAFLDEAYVEKYASTLVPGHYAMLAVSDTGLGMNAETLERIFDPFFTTKEGGRGTGLGLATVFGIIKQHQGHIWVYSQPGHGTTFKIGLPQANAIPPTTAPTVTGPISIHGTETVLVVEDEEMVRRFVCETLEAHGYDVIEAKSPTHGLRLAPTRDKIDLLLTDVVMPEMSGKALYQKLIAIHPSSKVLYMSGYTDDVIVHHGVLDEGIDFLQKPFTIQQLARKVRGALNE
jgi:PAS domain S-box-containing protein